MNPKVKIVCWPLMKAAGREKGEKIGPAVVENRMEFFLRLEENEIELSLKTLENGRSISGE